MVPSLQKTLTFLLVCIYMINVMSPLRVKNLLSKNMFMRRSYFHVVFDRMVCMSVCLSVCFAVIHQCSGCQTVTQRPDLDHTWFFSNFYFILDYSCFTVLCQFQVCVCMCVSCSVVSNSLRPHELQLARLLCPWSSLGKNTVGCPHLFL